MEFQQIRNATIIIKYAGKKLVIDPWLSDKGSERLGPIVDLPMPIEDIVLDVDAFFITHIHPDHFNEYGMPKDKQMYLQNKKDEKILSKLGFKDTCIMKEAGSRIDEIEIYKTKGIHVDQKPNIMGCVCGIVLKHPLEETVYIAGDTIWCPYVAETIKVHQPDVIIVNACGAKIPTGGRLIMAENDVFQVHLAAPKAKIIVSHMEAVSHATVSRKDMKRYVEGKGCSSNVYIPKDGEKYVFFHS